MTKAIIKGLLKLVTFLLNLALGPINTIIFAFFPDLSNMVGYVRSFFNILKPYIGWIVDASFISPVVLGFILVFYTFKLTFWFAIWVVKLGIHWYRKLMP